MTVQRTSEYTVGWIDTTIHDFLSDMNVPPASMAYALVTCLDSSFDVASMTTKSRRLQALKNQGKVVGNGILLTTRRLLALDHRHRLFFGFDEVWFFARAKVSPKPKDVVITGPSKISPQLMEHMAGWMRKNGCSLGLGDGTGMNFCARLRGIAKHLVESFSESESAGAGGGLAIA